MSQNENQREQQRQQNQQDQSSFNMSDYQQCSSQQIMVEFARHSYPLVGAIIDGNLIKGDFGYGQIQQPKNQRLIQIQNDQLTFVEQVSKIIITKSKISKKVPNKSNKKRQIENQQSLQNNNKKNQNIIEPINNQQEEQIQEEERFFSQSSQSSDQENRKQRENKAIKKKVQIKKTLQSKNQNKLSKNILKKKLKFLSRK